MTTDETNEQEAPGVRTNETDDDDDTQGHKTMHLSSEPEAPGVRTNETDDDTEGHIKMHQTSDPDFASQAPSRQTNATSDEDDTEGHVFTR